MKKIIIASFIAGLMAVSFAGVASADKPTKVAVCHVPGGNLTKAKIITVGQNAADKHENKHVGDFIMGDPGDPCPALD